MSFVCLFVSYLIGVIGSAEEYYRYMTAAKIVVEGYGGGGGGVECQGETDDHPKTADRPVTGR